MYIYIYNLIIKIYNPKNILCTIYHYNIQYKIIIFNHTTSTINDIMQDPKHYYTVIAKCTPLTGTFDYNNTIPNTR